MSLTLAPFALEEVDRLITASGVPKEAFGEDIFVTEEDRKAQKGISRGVIFKFLGGKGISPPNFVALCKRLGLDPYKVALELLKHPINNVFASGVNEFIGRSNTVFSIHDALQDKTKPNVVALTGMGGLGKTETAIQYAQANMQLYQGGVCWITVRKEDAPEGSDINSQILSFARRLGIDVPFEKRQHDFNTIQYCYDNWVKWDVLLIFDDVEEFDSEFREKYLPKHSRFKVIVTTRLALDETSYLYPIRLDELSETDSLLLLKSLVTDSRIRDELEQSKKLCGFLGGLPLALELAGKYLENNSGLTITTLLSELQNLADMRETLTHISLEGNAGDDLHGVLLRHED